MTKILAIYGSPRKDANTDTLVAEVAKGAAEAGAEIKNFYLRDMDLKFCKGCMSCQKAPDAVCVQKDDLALIVNDLKDADAVIIGSPIYFFQFNAATKNLLDRFYSLLYQFKPKYGAKKLITCYSQSSPAADAFKDSFAFTNKCYGALGLENVKNLVATNGGPLNSVIGNKELLAEAYEAGKNLA
ncbi:MAG: flavodoxin family protein [Clostridiales bacterium]